MSHPGIDQKIYCHRYGNISPLSDGVMKKCEIDAGRNVTWVFKLFLLDWNEEERSISSKRSSHFVSHTELLGSY